jgi:hypothetical protein
MLSVRATYRFASLMWCLSKDLPGELKWNADSTTFQIDTDNAGAILCVVVDNKNEVIGNRATSSFK